jgi:type I restriction enzyme R subunit
VLFVNGIPIITAELKNELTGQNVYHAIRQYQNDRDPKEKLFKFKRCIAHFAMDTSEVFVTTELKNERTFFLPFNKGAAGAGKAGGMGNPLDPEGEKTRYFWHEVLQRDNWLRILGSYIHVSYKVDEATGRKTGEKTVIVPRFHQWHSVEAMVEATSISGPGVNRLAQHSAGSGKSNSIAWLAHQLIGVKFEDKEAFDSVIVVTDRRILDDQIQKTIKQFMQVSATVGAVTGNATSKTEQLRQFIADGKKIIITTIQKPIHIPQLLKGFCNGNINMELH